MVRLKNRYALLSLTFKDGRAEAGSAAQFLTSLKAVIQLEYGAFGLAEAQPTLSGTPQAPVGPVPLLTTQQNLSIPTCLQ